MDWSDAFHFDHPIDHLPGSLFTDAGIRAHMLLIGKHPTSIAVQYKRYGEFQERVEVVSAAHGRSTRTSFVAEGSELASVICGNGPTHTPLRS